MNMSETKPSLSANYSSYTGLTDAELDSQTMLGTPSLMKGTYLLCLFLRDCRVGTDGLGLPYLSKYHRGWRHRDRDFRQQHLIQPTYRKACWEVGYTGEWEKPDPMGIWVYSSNEIEVTLSIADKALGSSAASDADREPLCTGTTLVFVRSFDLHGLPCFSRATDHEVVPMAIRKRLSNFPTLSQALGQKNGLAVCPRFPSFLSGSFHFTPLGEPIGCTHDIRSWKEIKGRRRPAGDASKEYVLP